MRAKLKQVLLRSCYCLGGICLGLATLAMFERNLKVILCASLFLSGARLGNIICNIFVIINIYIENLNHFNAIFKSVLSDLFGDLPRVSRCKLQ